MKKIIIALILMSGISFGFATSADAATMVSVTNPAYVTTNLSTTPVSTTYASSGAIKSETFNMYDANGVKTGTKQIYYSTYKVAPGERGYISNVYYSPVSSSYGSKVSYVSTWSSDSKTQTIKFYVGCDKVATNTLTNTYAVAQTTAEMKNNPTSAIVKQVSVKEDFNTRTTYTETLVGTDVLNGAVTTHTLNTVVKNSSNVVISNVTENI